MDLANDLGNLLSRTTAMADKYFGGNLPIEQDEGPEDAALLEKARGLRDRYEADMEAYAFQNALADVFEGHRQRKKQVHRRHRAVGAGQERGLKPRLARVLYNLAETLRICTVLLQPFMPTTCEKIFCPAERGKLTAEHLGLAPPPSALPVNATCTRARTSSPHRRRQGAGQLEALEAAQKAAAQAANAPAEEKEGKARRERARPADSSVSMRKKSRLTTSARSSCAWPRSAPASA